MNIPIRFLLLFCVLICKSCLLSAVNGHDLNIVILGDSNTSIGGEIVRTLKVGQNGLQIRFLPRHVKAMQEVVLLGRILSEPAMT